VEKGETATYSSNDTVEPLLEPRDRVLPLHTVLEADTSRLLLAASDTHTRATHDDVAGRTEHAHHGKKSLVTVGEEGEWV
jgi:hypothetical protein